jgi:DNA-binding transcriptional MerR regulator
MLEPSNNALLPEIPSKRYFTIGEVSELCDVKPHVLRYWEQEFPQLKPVKRRGNRRYYQRQDVMIIRNIRSLLYEQGYTIGGARLQLTDVNQQARADLLAAEPVTKDKAALSLSEPGDGLFHLVLQDMIKELEQVATLLHR